jgi:tRNA threonylcarbamoyladenosine biosynthesis protein TsaE
MEFQVRTESDLSELISYLNPLLQERPILFMYGDLGAGKTTTVKYIVRHLESEDDVSSPTFSLINEYVYPAGMIYHMDMYRLKSEEEAVDIGIEEYLESGEICIIEWPELLENIVDHNQVIKIVITVEEDGLRVINIE